MNPPNSLRAYGGTDIETVVTFVADIETADGLRKASREQFYVVNRAPMGLMSYETAKRLNLIRIGTDINLVESNELFPKIPNLKVKLQVDRSVAPVRNCSYKIPWALQPSTQLQLDTLQRQGIIELAPHNTEWMSTLKSVAKGSDEPKRVRNKEQERRLVINMRAVNEAILRENHPMPYLENQLPALSGAKFFSKIDLSSAFYHVELDEESRILTAFMTAKGPMRFTRLPFGINAAPEIFQRTMEKVLEGITGIVVYLDDILIFGKTEAELESRTKEVTKRLEENCLTINQNKSIYGKTEIDFLGHRISQSGIKPAVSKIEAIANFRLPTSKSELRSFLGLVTYISTSITNLSEKTSVLRVMLQKSVKLLWTIERKKAFNALKKDIQHEILERGFFQDGAETRVYTDASPNGLGAVLVQIQLNQESNKLEHRAIICISKSLTETEKRYPQTHKEALAIVWAVEKLHFYLLGREFVIYTDHEPLEFIFKKKNISDKRAMTRAEGWALRLSCYNYKLKRVSTRENIADPLSRICKQSDPPYEENYENYWLVRHRIVIQVIKLPLASLKNMRGNDHR